jgi:hypothetical protein
MLNVRRVGWVGGKRAFNVGGGVPCASWRSDRQWTWRTGACSPRGQRSRRQRRRRRRWNAMGAAGGSGSRRERRRVEATTARWHVPRCRVVARQETMQRPRSWPSLSFLHPHDGRRRYFGCRLRCRGDEGVIRRPRTGSLRQLVLISCRCLGPARRGAQRCRGLPRSA